MSGGGASDHPGDAPCPHMQLGAHPPTMGDECKAGTHTYPRIPLLPPTLLLPPSPRVCHRCRNVIDHPGEDKYRRVKASNAAYRTRLGCRPGGQECMAAIGFSEIMEAGEAVLVMTDVPEELPRVRTLLQQAVDQAAAAAAGAAAAQLRAAAATPPAAQPSAPAPAAAPAPTAATPPAAAAAGAAGASQPGASNVDATVLARALAAALGTGSGGPGAGASAGAAQTASTLMQPAAGAAAGRRRVIRVSPKGLARVLERVLAEAGIGVAPAGGHQQQQQGGGAQ